MNQLARYSIESHTYNSNVKTLKSTSYHLLTYHRATQCLFQHPLPLISFPPKFGFTFSLEEQLVLDSDNIAWIIGKSRWSWMQIWRLKEFLHIYLKWNGCYLLTWSLLILIDKGDPTGNLLQLIFENQDGSLIYFKLLLYISNY